MPEGTPTTPSGVPKAHPKIKGQSKKRKIGTKPTSNLKKSKGGGRY